MPRRRGRASAAIGGAFDAAGDIFGTLLRSQLAQDISNQNALRNDALERARTAESKISSGDWTPEQGRAYAQGKSVEPSTEQRLQGIFADIDKAPTMQTVPTKESGVARFKAARVPTVGFGPANFSEGTGDEGNLPSRQSGPVNSQPFGEFLGARAAKLRGFPDEKTGSVISGEGASAQPMDVFTKYNVDTGQREETQRMPSGPTAMQKGGYEGTASAETKRLEGPAQTANELATQTALMPIREQTAAREARARALATLKVDIQRAAMSGGLLPEQATAANEYATQFNQQSTGFWTQEEAMRRMVAFANDPSIAGDISTIYAYMKMNDPNSTVMQGEQATAQNAGRIPARLWAKYNELILGIGRLDPAQREDYLSQTRNMFNAASVEHDRRIKDYTARAMMRNIDPKYVIREPDRALGIVGTEVVINGRRVRITAADAQGNATATQDMGPEKP